MHSGDELTFDPQSFSGTVRLFPLPNVVLFPHVIQPLHIFEPRYRAMMEDALVGDRLIALALLAQGWEKDYEGRPAVQPVACLGRIATHHRLPDGRFNLLLLGLQRVRLLHELPAAKPFREARVELLDDVYPSSGSKGRGNLQARLQAAFKQTLVKFPTVQEQLDQLLGRDLPLGMLTDIVAHTLQLEPADKWQLLSEADVDRRAAILLQAFESLSAEKLDLSLGMAGERKYPPDFSVN